MSWSLGEVRSLSVKAARGAGLHWGLAEEAGFAVEWLEKRKAPGTEALASYLDVLSTDANAGPQTCPISFGALLSDTGDWNEHFPKSLHQPLLIVPFLALIAGNESLELSWNNQMVLLNSTGISSDLSTDVTSKGLFECAVRSGVASVSSQHRLSRVTDDRQAHIEVLGRYAHKTYAPATEASRTKGAGAGLSDND